MRIVIVDTTIHGSLIGGAQTFLPPLMKGLNQRGHEIHLVAKDTPDARIVKQIQESGAILHTHLWKRNALVVDAAPVFANWINNLQPDAYLVSVSADIGWLSLPYLNPRIATLAIGHTDADTFYSPARHYHLFLTRAIGVSHEVCHHYISDCHMTPGHVEWIPYGVESNPNSPSGEDNEILKMVYVGRLEEQQKRISDLAAIAKQLTAKGVNFSFKIIGDGQEMSKLRDYLSEEIVEKKVELLGWVSGREVINTLRQSDVFVLTSAYEGFCISLVEAMANGCCPVVTNLRSGNKELVEDAESGFLIEIGEVDSFVEKLKYLAQNRLTLLEMRNAAWKKGKTYSVSKMVESYEKCFEKAVEETKTVPRNKDPHFPVMPGCRSAYPLWLRRLKVLTKDVTTLFQS